MILKLKLWCESLIIAILVSVIIEIIIPEGSNKKYAKVIIGVYILYLILNPVFEFINEEPKIDFFSEYKYEEVNSNFDNNIKDIYILGIEENIKEELIDMGIEINDVQVTVDSNYENINKIMIDVNTKDNNEKIISYLEDKCSLDNIEIRSKYD